MDCKGLLRLNYDAIQITKQESFGLLVQSEDTLQRGLKGETRLRRVCVYCIRKRGLSGARMVVRDPPPEAEACVRGKSDVCHL